SDKNWKRTNKQDMSSAIGLKKRSFPESSTYFDLNLESFRQVLLSAPKEARSSNVIISVPNINGEMEQYKIWEYSNFAPELQAQFPNIRAYAGVGIKDKTASIRISLDPNGIQTMVLRADRKTEFIEPYTNDGKGYALFNSARSTDDMPFVCGTKEEQALVDQINNRSSFSNTQSFKTLRLALSCTGEYAAFYGGTVAGALAGMNATMTRVNGVYEIDLAIKLELIAQQASIIYLNAATDPYSDAGEAGSDDGLGADGAWNSELQNNLTATIGNDAYDIGHLFGASGGGGNAGCIGCVCVNPSIAVPDGKGSGFTSPGNGAPQGDAFDIDYVAHEMGHQ
ncbi:MAG: propanediol utilization protein, partial [Pedobacter sp.]